jgi:hypothetical protein
MKNAWKMHEKRMKNAQNMDKNAQKKHEKHMKNTCKNLKNTQKTWKTHKKTWKNLKKPRKMRKKHMKTPEKTWKPLKKQVFCDAAQRGRAAAEPWRRCCAVAGGGYPVRRVVVPLQGRGDDAGGGNMCVYG